MCKRIALIVAVLLLTGSIAAQTTRPGNVAERLQSLSVTVRAESGYSATQGSGIIVTRVVKDGNRNLAINFVCTAGHVVEGLRKVEEVIDTATGTKRSVVTYKVASIVKEDRYEGSHVGEWKYRAKVIHCDKEEDLAVLRILRPELVSGSAVFYLAKSIPSVGTDLYHVGSPGGQEVGAHSTTPGIVAQVGRTLDGKTYDQTTVAALPGSSGGGVFMRDGRCIGLLTLGLRGTDNFNYIVPVRRILAWAEATRLSWVFDPSVPVPTQEEIDKLPVEGGGRKFGREKAVAPAGHYFLIHAIAPVRSVLAPK